ncbi:MAG: oligosaccharide flippase family protein, partial [Spirochaetia bacterium]|nr:oligosaccharide flippase family protein [Spirochaetia bacterium]
APLIAAFFDMPELTLISRILFLSIVLGAFGIAHTAVLFRHLMIKERAKIDFFSLSLACVITLVFLYLDFGYWALVANQLSISFFGTLFRWIFSPWKPNFSFSITPLKEMFGFSSKLLIAEIVNSVQQNILSFMIGKHSTRADVGYFSEGKKWADTGTTFIYLMINGVAQPVFSKDISDKERTVKILHKLIHFSVFMSFPVMCGIAFISKDFISILNIEFLPCVPIMYIFCLLRTVYPILTLYTQLGTALGKSSFIFKSTLLLTIAQIVSAFIALPYGINWVALSNAVISLIYLLVWHFYISSLVPIKLSAVIKDIFPYAAVTGLVFLITWAATYRLENHYIAIIAKVSLCASLYLIIMKLTNSAIFNEIIEYLKKALNPILENIKK